MDETWGAGQFARLQGNNMMIAHMALPQMEVIGLYLYILFFIRQVIFAYPKARAARTIRISEGHGLQRPITLPYHHQDGDIVRWGGAKGVGLHVRMYFINDIAGA